VNLNLLLEVCAMKKTKKLLIFLILTFGLPVSYAQDTIQQNMHRYISYEAIFGSTPPNNPDSLETILTVYALIIGAYVLYWFRQKT
jgi:hypothetical protein